MTGRTETRLRDATTALGQSIQPQDVPDLQAARQGCRAGAGGCSPAERASPARDQVPCPARGSGGGARAAGRPDRRRPAAALSTGHSPAPAHPDRPRPDRGRSRRPARPAPPDTPPEPEPQRCPWARPWWPTPLPGDLGSGTRRDQLGHDRLGGRTDCAARAQFLRSTASPWPPAIGRSTWPARCRSPRPAGCGSTSTG